MSGTDFYYRPQIDLAERLAKVAPGPTPKKVFFTNSGAEAVEAALKLARWHTGRSRVVAFFGAFHGRTYGAMSLSGSKLVHRRGFSPLVPDIHHVAVPARLPGRRRARPACALRDGDRGHAVHAGPPRRTRWRRSSSSRSRARAATTRCRRAACRRCGELCDQHGILLVVDEVQSGMGRTGKMFAVEHYGVEPDIICLAKGIASGMPLGAIIAKADVMDWPPRQPRQHVRRQPGRAAGPPWRRSTCSSASTWRNAAARGEQLRAGLRELARQARRAWRTSAAWG